MNGRRSWLFVPGDSERKLAKGPATGADVLILDVEDSVSPARKPVARKMIADYLASAPRGGAPLWVRINALHTPYWEEDVAAAMAGGADGIVLPKPRSPADVFALAERMDDLEDGERHEPAQVLALAGETARGMLSLHGVDRTVEVPGTIVMEEGRSRVEAAFILKLADYRIEAPSLAAFLKVSQEIAVEVRFHLKQVQ